MSVFFKFPNEGSLIGELLTFYADIELDLCLCVAAARKDFDMVYKTMFRSRGESRRIQIADILGRQVFNNFDLDKEFSEAISAADFCRKIRNQYAHCLWNDDNSKQLGFVNLEIVAQKNKLVENLSSSKMNYVEISLLEEQLEYYKYTQSWFDFLNLEVRFKNGELDKRLGEPPKIEKRPTLLAT